MKKLHKETSSWNAGTNGFNSCTFSSRDCSRSGSMFTSAKPASSTGDNTLDIASQAQLHPEGGNLLLTLFMIANPFSWSGMVMSGKVALTLLVSGMHWESIV